jgi:xanthine dehydrogenase accessory factor
LIKQMDSSHRAAIADRLHSPGDLKPGGDGPEVLALSIAAELQQLLAMPG